MKARWWASGWFLVVVLMGCTLNADESKNPSPTVSTQAAWATPQTGTAASEGSATPIIAIAVTMAPTLTPPGETAALPSPFTQVAQALPSKTLLPSLTPTPQGILPTLPPPTAAPTLTKTPFGIVTLTPAPTLTNTPFVLPTQPPVPTFTPVLPSTSTPVGGITVTFGPPPSFTPAFVAPSFTPVVAFPTATTQAPPNAVVCETCDNLRLRSSPGTSGSVITMLPANAALTIIGRSADSQWVQVIAPDGTTGWVAVQYLVVTIDLNTVSITGDVVNAPTASGPGDPGTVVSGVSSTARRIFLDGLAKGNLGHSFTRVGDSISAAPQFLTQIGSGNYSLGAYSYLQTAINFFSGPNGRGANPFAASSLAARNGWGTTSILDPANADPNVCRPGETPLACEYRLVKPSVALIMVGTNDSGGLPTAEFQANVQAIVQTSITMGVIPVLTTIPPKHYNPATDGRVAEFNQVIIATARAYDIPLVDYGAVMRSTPGEGLELDGVHPSTPPDGITTIFDANHLNYGYTLRNLTALQALYTLWQYVLYDADTVTPATAPPSTGNTGTYTCPGALPPQLTVGGQGQVTPGLPNKVRSAPSFSAQAVGNIPGEGVFSVISGPTCADNYTWWQVNYNGLVGWTAQGDNTEYWVLPYP